MLIFKILQDRLNKVVVLPPSGERFLLGGHMRSLVELNTESIEQNLELEFELRTCRHFCSGEAGPTGKEAVASAFF